MGEDQEHLCGQPIIHCTGVGSAGINYFANYIVKATSTGKACRKTFYEIFCYRGPQVCPNSPGNTKVDGCIYKVCLHPGGPNLFIPDILEPSWKSDESPQRYKNFGTSGLIYILMIILICVSDIYFDDGRRAGMKNEIRVRPWWSLHPSNQC